MSDDKESKQNNSNGQGNANKDNDNGRPPTVDYVKKSDDREYSTRKEK